jgi:hypothetical protein
MFDKPALNVAYNPYGVDISPRDFALYYTWDHYKPIVDTDALHIAYNEESLMSDIKTGLENPSLKNKQRKELITKFFGDKLDGKAFLRIADVIDKAVESN